MLSVVLGDEPNDEGMATVAGWSLVDEIVREVPGGCWPRLLAEVDAYIALFREELDEYGHRLLVRNGYRQ